MFVIFRITLLSKALNLPNMNPYDWGVTGGGREMLGDGWWLPGATEDGLRWPGEDSRGDGSCLWVN